MKRLKVTQTCGVGGWRYNGALPDSERNNVISVSSGSNIALWEVSPTSASSSSASTCPSDKDMVRFEVEEELTESKAHRLSMIEAHEDLVTVLLRSPSTQASREYYSNEGGSVVATASYGGEVTLWSSGWSLKLCSARVRLAKLVHLSFSRDGQRLAATSLYHGGLITVFKIQLSGEGKGYTLELEKEFSGAYYCAEFTSQGTIFAYKEDPDEELPRGDGSPPPRRRWKATPNHYTLELLSLDSSDSSKPLRARQVTDRKLAEVAVRNETHEDVIALSHSGRFVDVVHMRTLELLWTLKVVGSGLLTCLCFWDNAILCPNDDGTITVVNNTSESGAPSFEIRKFDMNVLNSGPVFYVGFADSAKTQCWIGTVGAVHLLHLNHPISSPAPNSEFSPSARSQLIQYHSVTCCGVDIDPTGLFVAAGDFGRNVLIWSVTTGTIVARCCVAHPVRSLAWWRPPSDEVLDSFLLIGCTDGTVHYWKPQPNQTLERIAQDTISSQKHSVVPIEFATPYLSLEGTVTCIRWEQSPSDLRSSSGDSSAELSRRVAIGTTSGTLALLRDNSVPYSNGPSLPTLLFAVKAHKPVSGPQDLNFGSLGKFAEIWSVAWSPSGRFIATTSEDQTTCIWNLAGEKVRGLTGHTLAVTSVDWRQTVLGTLLVTCADDRTVLVYDGEENVDPTSPSAFELKFKLETSDIPDWHTVTYLSLEDVGDPATSSAAEHQHLVVATQNGYVVAWELKARERVAGKKMHVGSIEGLAWHSRTGLIASCSSDCSVNLYTLQL